MYLFRQVMGKKPIQLSPNRMRANNRITSIEEKPNHLKIDLGTIRRTNYYATLTRKEACNLARILRRHAGLGHKGFTQAMIDLDSALESISKGHVKKAEKNLQKSRDNLMKVAKGLHLVDAETLEEYDEN